MTDYAGLKNKVAIVTGAAGDIGKATINLLISHEAKILALDIDPAVHSLAQGERIITQVCDVSREQDVVSAVALAQSAFGQVDMLINNAGITLNKPATETAAEEWDHIMAVNARGYFLFCREALKAMQPRQQGAIVNVASIVSVVGMKTTAAYSASKGAIAQLTRVLALEAAEQGIRVNAVAPGVVETDMLSGIVEDSRATLASYGHAHPPGRVAQPQEIAEAIVWLASPKASFVTGTVLMADGGYTAQ
ncbi:SDR family NAD(P)-dependent oxidoreductase [Franconibacter pulveris]|uniref:SDR family NAD(P)-dependent oxidoreductase n=1 Tax=Franconibacter pulveris TaxID=435910 RepID=UPI000495D5CF|nr:SDR family oxidoreductase [Franconibacter pulveris]